MYVTIPRNGSEQSYRYARSADGREIWTKRTTAWDREMRSETVYADRPREMASKFAGKCAACGQRFPAGTAIIWSKSAGAKHVECPKATTRVTAPVAAAKIEVTPVHDNRPMMDRADDLLDEYAATMRRQNVMTRKAIYRVSLTGESKQYGIDYINVAMIPSEAYGSVKVSEHRGEGIGRINRDGSFTYWPDVDQNAPRVKAIRAAVEIILQTADPLKLAQAFAVESEQCMRCGDDLTDDLSRERKLGPTCFKKW